MLPSGGMNRINQDAFMIRLQSRNLSLERSRLFFQQAIDIVQRRSPINFGLSQPQQIEIRAMQNKNTQQVSPSSVQQ